MYQSRCGVCCDECTRKENVHCQGCIHCGECEEFPCQMCAKMGEDMGFDSAPRLQKCREWAKEKVGSH